MITTMGWIDVFTRLNQLPEGLEFNAQWIQNRIDNGYHIYDIGPRGSSINSSYYNLEVGRTLNYQYLHNTYNYNPFGLRINIYK